MRRDKNKTKSANKRRRKKDQQCNAFLKSLTNVEINIYLVLPLNVSLSLKVNNTPVYLNNTSFEYDSCRIRMLSEWSCFFPRKKQTLLRSSTLCSHLQLSAQL